MILKEEDLVLKKAKKYLNWSPEISLIEGLKQTISSYKDIFMV